MQDKFIYTLGTDLRSAEDFIEILLAYEISAVIDVRSFPRSKMSHFSRGPLAELLAANEISYHFLGKELGGFRKGGYTAYLVTEEFSHALEMIESIAENNIPVIICSEKFPWKCHRKWISRELRKRGWGIIHIIDKGKVWEPK
jgi:uncharacterized protein (DUF488 family)